MPADGWRGGETVNLYSMRIYTPARVKVGAGPPFAYRAGQEATMLKRLVLAALLCAGSVHAQHLEGANFSVDYTATSSFPPEGYVADVSIAGGVLWWSNPARSFSVPIATGIPATYSGSFQFQAREGYEITGYTVSYHLSLNATPWTIQGNEDNYFQEYRGGLPIGTIVGGTGTFQREGAEVVTLDVENPGGIIVDVFTDLPVLGGVVHVNPLPRFCTLDPIYRMCENEIWLGGDMALGLTIEPLVVSHAPEPTAWLLMLLGLLAVGRHCSLAPMSISPALRTLPR
jgi:hypothetical protein